MTAPEIAGAGSRGQAVPQAVDGEHAGPYIARVGAYGPPQPAATASPWDESAPEPGDAPSSPGVRERAALVLGKADKATAGAHWADKYKPTVREKWDHHKTHARRFAPLVKVPRALWGVLAVTIRLLFDLFEEWVLDYPHRALAVAVVVAALWLWLF